MPNLQRQYSQAIPIMSQAVDTLVGDAQRKQAFARQQEARIAGEGRQQEAQIAGEDRAFERNKTGLRLQLLNQRAGIAQTPQEHADVLSQASDVIGGATDLDPDLFKLPEGPRYRTPASWSEYFPGVELPETVSKQQYDLITEQQKVRAGQEKAHEDLLLQQAKTGTEKQRRLTEIAKQLSLKAGSKTKQIPSETHKKAEIHDKGLENGYDTLTPDERQIIGLDEMKDLESTRFVAPNI